jgi:uncharacterized lipoprotein YmbA
VSKILIVIMSVILLGCAQTSELSYFLISAQSLSYEAQKVEAVLDKVSLETEDRESFEQALRSIKMNVMEIQRYEGVDIVEVDIRRLERNYLVLRDNISYVSSVVIRDNVWATFTEYEKMELERLYRELIALSEDIERFREGQGDYLKRAAKITAFSSVAIKVLLKVAEVYL